MNQGQICLCTSRILVEMSIYEKFKSDFINRISNLKIGDPAKKTTEFGERKGRKRKGYSP